MHYITLGEFYFQQFYLQYDIQHFMNKSHRQHEQNSKMIVKGDKSNLAQECGVKAFQQGVRNKEFQQTYLNTANLSFKYYNSNIRFC